MAGVAVDFPPKNPSLQGICYRIPLESSRKTASSLRRMLPSARKGGMGEPGLTHEGQRRCRIWKPMPRWCEPIAVKSGAPKFDAPAPA